MVASRADPSPWQAGGVAEITVEIRTRECDALIDAAVAARREPEARVEALRVCVAHPCAYHEFDLPELYRTLGETLARRERYDESIEAWEAAIAAGERGVPHPRASVGEVLLRAGRKEEADILFADLRRRCPGDIWLRSAAGFSYAWVGDYAAALPWLDEGVGMALADDDAEGILAQLDEERSRCRAALGLARDDVSAQVAQFQSQQERPAFALPPKEMFGDATPDRSPCSHCGWDERDEPATAMRLDEVEWLADNTRRRRLAEALGGETPQPIVVAKIGRNERCPCGSGLKYKRCCGR